jgi:predicted Rossmann fold flavoprotein
VSEDGLDTWQCSVYYKGAHKSNPFIDDNFLKDNPEREAILNGEKRFDAESARKICSEMDFLPKWSKETLVEQLENRRGKNLCCEDLLTGILHNRLGRVLTQAVGIRGRMPVQELNRNELDAVCTAVKEFRVSVTEPMGMDSAQVTAGGIVTDEFDPTTMCSKLVPGLYACGEVLDVDGDCGGYNLQWAWSSGRCAGLAAGKESYD